MKQLSSFEEDCIWMSYRYCIGRHTIAAHSHASEIAENVYNRLSPNRMQFMSEDINNEIHNIIHYGNFIDMGWYGNVPKQFFRPLDVVYSIFDKENIDSLEKIKSIKTIQIDWNNEKQDFDYSIYYFNDDDKNKDYGRSFNDLIDLEVWQRLANLFDRKNYKRCIVNDNSEIEYYEAWGHYYDENRNLKFKKYKHPVDNKNFYINCYIDESQIKQDDTILCN